MRNGIAPLLRRTSMIASFAALASLVSMALTTASAAEPEQRTPSPGATGQVYVWKSGDDLAYEFYVPASYDHAKGTNLVLILHDSNLDRRFGFANHAVGKFRPDDVIVCPDGTTANGSGGFNYRHADKDLRRFHSFHQELLNVFNVRATFVYGHGHGAYFAFAYAGTQPRHVQGVVGHGGGVWRGTKAPSEAHPQAISIVHGTADPVEPFASSAAARRFFVENRYPHVHLRALRGSNHWADAGQAAQQLAWCEAVTTTNAERVIAAFEELAAIETGGDPVVRWEVAKRAGSMAQVSAEVRSRAAAAVARVEALAEAHVTAIQKSLGRAKGDRLEKKPWIGHARAFLQEFDGLPRCDALREEWKDRLDGHRERAARADEEYRRLLDEDPSKAFVAGVDVIAKGFLAAEYANADLLERLNAWREQADELGISRSDQKYFDKVVPVFEQAMEQGKQEFDEIQ